MDDTQARDASRHDGAWRSPDEEDYASTDLSASNNSSSSSAAPKEKSDSKPFATAIVKTLYLGVVELREDQDDRIMMSLFWDVIRRDMPSTCTIEVKNSKFISSMERLQLRKTQELSLREEELQKDTKKEKGKEAEGKGDKESSKVVKRRHGAPRPPQQRIEGPTTFTIESSNEDSVIQAIKLIMKKIHDIYEKKKYASDYFMQNKDKKIDYRAFRDNCDKVANKLMCKVVPMRGYDHGNNVVHLCCTGTSTSNAEENLSKAAAELGLKLHQQAKKENLEDVSVSFEKEKQDGNSSYKISFNFDLE